MLAILTRATASVLPRVLGDAEQRLVVPGQGAGVLAEAARVPADTLVLDVATGSGLGPAVLRYRLARPQTRIVLLALGCSPGDPEVARVVQGGVYDVVTEASGRSATDPRTVGAASLSTGWLSVCVRGSYMLDWMVIASNGGPHGTDNHHSHCARS